MLGKCEIHGGDVTEVMHIQFCGESVQVCNPCLEEQTGAKSRHEFLDIQDSRYYELRDKLLEAADKT